MSVKKLFREYLKFLNGESWKYSGNIGTSNDITIALPTMKNPEDIRLEGRRILSKRLDDIYALINMYGLRFALYSYENTPTRLVPIVHLDADYNIAMFALASSGKENYLSKVGRCRFCEKLFLRFSQRSRFCPGKVCRTRYFNILRKENGYFKTYYRSRAFKKLSDKPVRANSKS